MRLERAIAEDAIATPEQIECNTITLLQSGVCGVDDLEALFDRFDDEHNSTMLKIIGKHCADLAATKTDPQDSEARRRLTMIGHAASSGQTSIMKTFDALCEVADRFSGVCRRPDGSDFNPSSAAEWERVTGELVENF